MIPEICDRNANGTVATFVPASGDFKVDHLLCTPGTTTVSARRVDEPAMGWGMNLQFHCTHTDGTDVLVTIGDSDDNTKTVTSAGVQSCPAR